MFETLEYQLRGQAALIAFNRPEMLNPLDELSGQELVNALEEASRDERVRAIILTGRGKAFSAGGNIRLMADFIEAHPGQGLSGFFAPITSLLNRSILAIRQAPKPVIAAVNGVAAGGGLGWVLACDLILAVPEARFDTAYIRIALCPDGANSFYLPRLIGPKRATELFFLGQALSAEEAKALGLVNAIVPAHMLLDEALALASRLASQSAKALARTKALIAAAFDSSLAEQLELERQNLLASADEPDFREGIKAFFARKG